MTRLLGPDLNSRLAYVPAGGVLSSAAGMSAVAYANPTGSTLADIQIYNGTSVPAGPVPNSTLTVDADSLIPLFWFPDDIDIVYIEVNGGTRTPANADYDARIDHVSGEVDGPLISTGLLSGGAISVNAGNPKAIDIAPFTGYVVDYITNPMNPTVQRITSLVTQTIQLSAAGQTRFVTWWMVDSAGAIVQQASRPSNTQRRTHIQLGTTIYDTSLGIIFVAETIPVILPQIANQFFDLLYALGAFSVTGNIIAPDGANLTFTKTEGYAFVPSFRYELTPVDPHIVHSPTQNPVTFRHITRASDVTFGTFRTTVDVANYDVNGVVTPVGGGAGSATIFRVWLLGSTTTAAQVLVQYGQTVYSSLTNAIAAIGRTGYVVNQNLDNQAVLLGHIAVTRTATNLADPAQASVIPSDAKFLRA